MEKYTLFYKQQFYNQRQAEIGKKIKQILSNTLRLNFCYLKIIHILHPRYHPKIIGHILKNKQKDMNLCIHEIIRLIIMKMRMKMKNRSHRYKINRSKKSMYIIYLKGAKVLSLITAKSFQFYCFILFA